MPVNSTETASLVQAIHAAGCGWVLACTGGGSKAIAELLEVPGASRSLLEAVVPYANEALIDWIHGQPDQFCAPRTARAMAMAAYRRAGKLGSASRTFPPGEGLPRAISLAGLGCTASLASDRPKRGAHRIHVAAQTSHWTRTRSLAMLSDRRSRSDEEELAARLTLDLMAESLELPSRLSLPLFAGEEVERNDTLGAPEWRELLLGRIDKTLQGKSPGEKLRRLLFPGAFNPRHDGHLAMAAAAESFLGGRVEWELSIENVDKPPLDFTEIAERCRQFSAEETLWLTCRPRFTEKAATFPNCTFLVGADTVRRLADERYYQGQSALRDRAIAELVACGVRFLVFGRVEKGQFLTLEQCRLPAALCSICDEMPESLFRRDISSTELRRAAQYTALDE